MHMLLLTFSVVLPYCDAIRCYECYIVPTHPYKFNANASVNVCDKFDYSQKFVTECVNSTFCRKTIYKGSVEVPLLRVERGCANQDYYGLRYENQVYYDYHSIVRDAYNSGCSTSDTYGVKSVQVENCYCDTDFCNQSSSINGNVLVVMLIVLYFIIF
ncbi:unnamed protein product [Acanthoscelides obtectus]|uniref:Protein sleepless n=1 Tax=Acanthoscelides obtectus TaxID=200917 RepID=A0A9P0KB90_ACAOB|nr:unnamed protein product [Acanthoscelides obtectus]CAK1662331.1 hypothetical protein AOBTE_LOCUS23084 [Acanthoscelides obtectus]